MYTYIFKGTKARIHTPGISDLSQIRKETIQKADQTLMRQIFPNGFILDIDQRATEIIVYSNRPLTQNPDGSYTLPEA